MHAINGFREGMMTDLKAMRALVAEAYEARGHGNIDGVMSAFHADALFQIVGDKKVLPIAEAFRGHANVREAMNQFIASFEFIGREIISIIAEGDRAAVHSRLTIRFTPKNMTVTTEVVDLFKFKDGKILELTEFADTALIKELLSS